MSHHQIAEQNHNTMIANKSSENVVRVHIFQNDGKNQNCIFYERLIKSSWATSCVKWLNGEKTNVSRTISVLVLRVLKYRLLKQPDKSVVVKHNFNRGHRIDFSSTSVLDKTTGYMDCLMKEAIEIRLNTGNFNRDNGFMLSQAWYPVMNMLSYQKAGRNRVST
jgi:hypothetical protein